MLISKPPRCLFWATLFSLPTSLKHVAAEAYHGSCALLRGLKPGRELEQRKRASRNGQPAEHVNQPGELNRLG